MLILFLIVVALLLVLGLLLTAWSMWFQAYLYTEAGEGLVWRGPAAGGAIVFFLVIWIFVDYKSVGPEGVGRYRPIYEFSASEAAKPYAKLTIPGKSGPEVYQLQSGAGRVDYRPEGRPRGQPLPSRPDRITVEEDGKSLVFEPERDEKGNFKQRQAPWYSLNRSPDPLRYVNKDTGKVMVETQLGVPAATVRGSWLIGNLLLNLLLLVACFLSWWLLLRFQWPAALLQAVILWAVLLLFVLPPVLARVEQTAKERSAPRA